MDRPNIILIFSDQQRADTLGCYKNPMGLTPNLDKLAQEGVRFENAFTNQPVCGPARGCLFTGKYATTMGVWRNGLGINPGERTSASILSKAGYQSAYIGKWHLAPKDACNNGAVPPEYRGGFGDLWEGVNTLESTTHPYEGVIYDEKGDEIRFKDTYRVDFLTERTIRFIRERDREKPFFLSLSFLEPHQQNDWKRMAGPDGYARQLQNPYVPPDLKFFPGDWQEQLPDYYACVRRIDECTGKIIGALKESGDYENTVIIYTSDHGCHFKTRNTEYKRSCHEASIRIPLIVSGPGCEKSVQPRNFASIVDITPTILELAGEEIPGDAEGKSLKGILAGENPPWEDEIFIQISGYMTGRAIRTPRWKYCAATPQKAGRAFSETYTEYQLYDLYSDPWELVNLAGRSGYREISEVLRHKLSRKIEDTEKRKADILPPLLYP